MDEMQEHPYSETEITDTKNNVRRKLIEAKSRGDMPGWLQEVLDANLKAKVDYRSELREFIMPEIKAYSTFSRTNRRTYGTMMPGIILPGMKREGLFVHFYVDTSGSIGQLEARQFISEIKGMFKQFDPGMVTAQIHLHDTTVYSTIDAHSLQDVETVEIRGGGGTSHIQPMENAEDEGAQVAIFLTDGYSDFPESTKIPKMLWVVTSEDGAKRIPEHFGKRIIIAPEDLRE
jgi:predicted metal-dependent peptidase